MPRLFERSLALLLAFGFASICYAAVNETSSRNDVPVPASGDDQIVVYGSIGDLRKQLLRAQDDVFARFNEINSTDKFDIHCSWAAPIGTRILARRCVSNSWREQDANMAAARVQELQGTSGTPWEAYWGMQASMQKKLVDEARRLAMEDQVFAKTLLRFGLAKQALDRRTPPLRRAAHEVEPLFGTLPYGAQRVIDVHTGRKPWTRDLDYRTFTFGDIDGEVRGVTLACEHGEEHIEFQTASEWTVPDNLGHCTLQVATKPGTLFTLYEFE